MTQAAFYVVLILAMFLFLLSGVGLFWLGLWVGSKSLIPPPPFAQAKPPTMTPDEIEGAEKRQREENYERSMPMPFMEKKL